jgi:hypothetical protein
MGISTTTPVAAPFSVCSTKLHAPRPAAGVKPGGNRSSKKKLRRRAAAVEQRPRLVEPPQEAGNPCGDAHQHQRQTPRDTPCRVSAAPAQRDGNAGEEAHQAADRPMQKRAVMPRSPSKSDTLS